MALVTVTTAAQHIKEVWSKKTLKAVEFGTVLKPRVCHEYTGEIKNGGDTIHLSHISNYTANDKSAGTAITPEAMTHSKTSLTIDKHKVAAFEVEHIVEVQSHTAYENENTRKLGYAIARAVDVDIANEFQNYSGNTPISTYGVEFVYDDFLDAWKALATAGAIEEGRSEEASWFLSVAAWVGALKIENLINRDYRPDGGEALKRAQLGEIFGAPTFMSNLLRAPAAGQHDNAFIHRDATACCMQENIRMESEFIVLDDAQVHAAHAIYGVDELTRPVETAGSVSTTDNFGVLMKGV